MVHLLITRRDAECLEDALKSLNSKAQQSTIDSLLKQLNHLLRGGQPRKDGWAPIKSSWPTAATVKRQRKSDPYYHKPRSATGKSPKQPKVPMTAQQILDSLT